MSERVDVSNGIEGKQHLMSLVHKEYQGLLDIAVNLDDKQWEAQSPCDEWEVRDVVGHMVDAVESYLGYFAHAEKGWDTGEPLGWGVYAEALSPCALSFRRLPRLEVLARLEGLSKSLFAKFGGLDAEQWVGGVLIPHRYGGPLPPFVMAVFQLIDYAVHSWDIRVATGGSAGIDYDTAQPLVPFVIGVYNFVFDAERAAGKNIALQYDIEHPGGEIEPWTVAVRDGQLEVVPCALDSPDAVLRMTPDQLLLRVFRQEDCKVTGDEAAVARFEGLLGTV